MGFYKILSTPLSRLAPNKYKGLYRSEPFPKNDSDGYFMELWEQYIQYQEDCTENRVFAHLPINELKEFATQATKTIGDPFEVVYTSENNRCPHNAIYYGVDVVGIGGYSLIGDGLFIHAGEEHMILCVIGDYFRKILNAHSLFNTEHEALQFKRTLEELMLVSPNLIENEDWKCVHVFGLRFEDERIE